MRMQRGWLLKFGVIAAVLVGLPLSNAHAADSSPSSNRWLEAGTRCVTSHPLVRLASWFVDGAAATDDQSAAAELKSEREWTHRDGRRAKLTFLEVRGNQVAFLRATDGRVYEMALADLAVDDRGLIEQGLASRTVAQQSHFTALQQEAAAAAPEMATPNKDAWRKALETVLRNAAEKLGPISATAEETGDAWVARLVDGLDVSADGKTVTWSIVKLADGHPTDEDQTTFKGLLENDVVQQLNLDTAVVESLTLTVKFGEQSEPDEPKWEDSVECCHRRWHCGCRRAIRSCGTRLACLLRSRCG